MEAVPVIGTWVLRFQNIESGNLNQSTLVCICNPEFLKIAIIGQHRFFAALLFTKGIKQKDCFIRKILMLRSPVSSQIFTSTALKPVVSSVLHEVPNSSKPSPLVAKIMVKPNRITQIYSCQDLNLNWDHKIFGTLLKIIYAAHYLHYSLCSFKD